MRAPIDLQLGWPSTTLHPTAPLLAGAAPVLTPPDSATALNYGPGHGYGPLRASIASWLTRSYTPRNGDGSAYAIPASRIMVGNGASATLLTAVLRLADPSYTRAIWMVEPTYFLACPIFADAGFGGDEEDGASRMRGVPEDEEGIDVRFLRESIERVEAEVKYGIGYWGGLGLKSEEPRKKGLGPCKIYKHVLYMVPTWSNPSAKTMSLRRREEVVRLARELDVLVVTDDVYDVLRWPVEESVSVKELGPLPPRIVDVDRVLDGGPKDQWGNALSNGSFSKIIAPGIRASWVESTPAVVDRVMIIGSTRSGGNPAHFSSMFVHQLLSTGALQNHIDTVLVPTYRRRYHVLMSAIEEYLVPLGVVIDVGKKYEITLASSGHCSEESGPHYPESAGGFFTYVMLPSDLPPAGKLAAIARDKHKCKFAFGDMFKIEGDPGSAERARQKGGFEMGIRLCWAWLEEEQLVEGVKRMAETIKDVRSEQSGRRR
ncbi:Aminotransferase protein [Lasiodiplodia theobromae]|uniref:Aminotransferase protein n=1 Tax=Lasiodiplodia theobromae TaxID=45133 RepID=UPI0015C311BF|nr:Aminotransferase protein [Lasiodiplodia theobromae]KAF4539992.1 Aminotransferase protein [Lasiodiplodia theobromae]